MSNQQWWKIQAEWKNIDEDSYLLFELGIKGLQIISDHQLECFIYEDENGLNQFKTEIQKIGLLITECEPADDKNWLEKCEEIWKPVIIKNITVIPVMSAENCPQHKNKTDILLIPGEGFGTGHHTTTSYITEILQSINFNSISPKRSLDVGCGSGILALVLEKLSDFEIDAIDNDPAAIANAADNLKINNSSRINLCGTELCRLEGKYGLIVANIYAEVLLSMKQEFERITAPGAYLILSGIMSKLSDNLIAEFTSAGWELKLKMDSGEWVALALTRGF